MQLSQITHTLSEAPITNTVAAAAITSPLWLENISHTAAILLPIFGCAWLLLQIGFFLVARYQDKGKSK